MSQVKHHEKALVTFRDDFDMDRVEHLKVDFMRWGASDILKTFPPMRVILLELEVFVSVDDFAKKASGSPDIASVEEVPLIQLAAEMRVAHDRVLSAWHLERLHCDAAHRKTKGFRSRVAVIDTGIGYHAGLPSTDLVRARESLLGEPGFWDETDTKDMLFGDWVVDNPVPSFLQSPISYLKQYTTAFGKLSAMAAFVHLQKEVFDRLQRNQNVNYPTNCPRNIQNVRVVDDVTLADLHEYSGLPDVQRQIGTGDYAEITNSVIPAFRRDVFNRDYHGTILRGYQREFRQGAKVPLLHDIMYRSRVWQFDKVYRTVALESTSFVANDPSLFDYDGHGTAVAGVLADAELGIAPECELIVLKVCKHGDAGADLSNLLEAIDRAVVARADVIYFGVVVDPPPNGAVNQALKRACGLAEQHNILMVAPVGNKGGAVIPMPASLDSVVAVSSLTPNLDRSSFSNFGAKVEISAFGGGAANPAVMRQNLYERWDQRTDILTVRTGGGYEMGTGTSYAAAQVAAAAALIHSRYQHLSGATLRTRLQRCVDSHFLNGQPRSPEAGYGLLNLAGI